MDAFVQMAEVWIPENGAMQLRSGCYGSRARFGEISAKSRFAFGEGLPGSVWSSGKPQVWDDLSQGQFVRLAEAQAAGLDAAVGIPIAAGGRETNAVAVLLCGSREHTGGCIERWDLDPSRGELRHAGGYYGNLEAFARMSPRMRFPMGHGLPGLTAKSGMPTIIDDTRTSDSFLRAQYARDSGVEAGIGIPIYRDGQVAHVLVLLSAQATPLARAFEVWVPDESDTLKLSASFYGEDMQAFAEASKKARAKVGRGLAGRVFSTELPQVWSGLHKAPFVRHEQAIEAGLTMGVGIPVSDGRRMLAAVLLLS